MKTSVALRERGRLATLVNSLLHRAAQQPGWRGPDPRLLRTWRQFVWGVWTTRSTRLVTVAQAIAPWRQVGSVKAAAMALGYLLADAQWAARPFSSRLLLAALEQLDAARLATHRGYALLVIDPTEYPKRSRGPGKRGRHMQHIGRVRRSARGQPRRGRKQPGAPARPATTTGYVDVGAGLVLKGKQFFPLARQLYSSRHPRLRSQNRVEEAVLGMARGLARRMGLRVIAVGDRGLGRKELLIGLAQQDQAFVFRIDADILASPDEHPPHESLAALLAQQPGLGQVIWERGEAGPLVCQARQVRATIRYSRTGRQADYTEATLHFVELVPLDPAQEPLVLATTLPTTTLAEVAGVAGVYAQRWSIETAFEALKGWGLERFMVRGWDAIDRLLWIVALAYTVLLLALRDPAAGRLARQAVTLLRRQAVLGRRLTVGKLAEAMALDARHHGRAWRAVWLL
jgi:Transposase DDE domain